MGFFPALYKMKKDVEGKKSNENSTMKKVIPNYPDKVISVCSISIPEKGKAAPTRSAFHQFEKGRVNKAEFTEDFQMTKMKSCKF